MSYTLNDNDWDDDDDTDDDGTYDDDDDDDDDDGTDEDDDDDDDDGNICIVVDGEWVAFSDWDNITWWLFSSSIMST